MNSAMENGLVGKLFLTTSWSEVLEYRVPWRGQIVENLGADYYRIETLDLVIAEFESCKIIHISSMAGWRLFSSREEWLRVSDRAITHWNHKYVVERVLQGEEA